ncbi:MAG: hypothetical protein M3Z64_01760 [Verrucomicrobiota bacterium]|nr:hypothetical protein [Verrucomicrobiota bacterium]
MKPKSLSIGLVALAATLQCVTLVSAQQPQERPSVRAQAQRSARLAALNDDEQIRLRAAHDKALQDQQVRAAHDRLQQARREYRDVMGPAMLRADPSVQPILEKMRRPARPSRDRN